MESTSFDLECPSYITTNNYIARSESYPPDRKTFGFFLFQQTSLTPPL